MKVSSLMLMERKRTKVMKKVGFQSCRAQMSSKMNIPTSHQLNVIMDIDRLGYLRRDGSFCRCREEAISGRPHHLKMAIALKAITWCDI